MLMAQPLQANITRPLNAAVNTTIPKAVNATQAQVTSGNLGAANVAMNNYTKAANQIAVANSNIPNAGGST
jgi:hypothetical protein